MIRVGSRHDKNTFVIQEGTGVTSTSVSREEREWVQGEGWGLDNGVNRGGKRPKVRTPCSQDRTRRGMGTSRDHVCHPGVVYVEFISSGVRFLSLGSTQTFQFVDSKVRT